MIDAQQPVTVRQDRHIGRFEILVGDVVAGVVTYREAAGVRTFLHTTVQPDYEGRGLANRLIREALDVTRAAGLHVEAQCEFTAGFIRRHQEYADLLAEQPHRKVLGDTR